MRFSLEKNWWSLVLRGIIAIAVGLGTFIWPRITLAALVFLFAGYAVLQGILSIAGAVHAIEARERWGALMFEGIIGIAAGVVAVGWPKITLLTLVLLLGAFAILTGICEIVAAMRLRRHVTDEWLLALGGIVSVIFGFLVIAAPAVGALVIAMWFGGFTLLVGALLVALGLRLRTWDRTLHAGPRIPAPVH